MFKNRDIALLTLLLISVAVSACDSPSAHIGRASFGTSDVLTTTGNLRLVTERHRIVGGIDTHVVCTEPSPDYAIAFGAKASLGAKLNVTGVGEGEGTGTYERSEQATALEGRTAGVLALRDGLYAACQAYVNGVIGHDAYALILSQYGNLLVGLAGAPASVTVSIPAGADAKGAATAAAIAKAVATASGTASRGNDGVAALLVACLSSTDQTREPALPNRLLSVPFCQNVLRRVANHAGKGA